jgi:outer membrane protein assembly factor BamE (lipoprotein component of BamABCDE complex)
VRAYRWWMLVVMLPLLSGCLVEKNQHGREIDPLLLAEVTPGVSTKSDILRILGVPSRESVIQDREAWVYDYSTEENRVIFVVLYTEKRKTIQQRSVAVLFSGDRVSDYVFFWGNP